MAQNCADMIRMYDIKHKSNKKNTSSTITRQECRQICTFDFPLIAASELLKSTVAGKLFHIFTILFAKKFVLALLVAPTSCFLMLNSHFYIISQVHTFLRNSLAKNY